MQVRGFILQSSYRIAGGRPVVLRYGRLADGRTFLVRDGRARPRCYIRSADRERAAALGAGPLCPAGRVTMAGEPVDLIETALPQDIPPLRQRLEDAGVRTYEADIRFAARALIDGDLRGPVRLRGAPCDGAEREGVDLLFDDPDLVPDPAGATPELSVLSLDIETDPSGRVLAIALSGCGADEVLLLLPRGRACPPGATPFAGEGPLLAELCRRVRALDPDILTGWNVIDFDLQMLLRAASRAGHRTLQLGRGPGALRVEASRGFRGAARASVPGRLVLDGLQLLRGSFIPMEEQSLDFIARAVLGEGKLISGKDRGAAIMDLYERDLPAFCAYNLRDAQLVPRIFDKLRLLDLTVARARLSGMPLDRVSAAVASVDFLYLSALARRGVVAPSHRDDEPAAPTAGGHVLDPRPGLHHSVVVFDFKSLYPSVIRTFDIDPLGHALAQARGAGAEKEAQQILRAPNGAAFLRQRGVLTEILDALAAARAAAKAVHDDVQSHAIKILMNSFYGALGTTACRFYDAALANSITSFGKEILLWTKAQVEREGFAVLYGDTDSLFVRLRPEGAPAFADHQSAQAEAQRLCDRLNHALSAHLRRKYDVESRLELEIDRVFLKLLLPHLRGGGAGARKRYAGLALGDAGEELVFVGLEAVRRDWTPLAQTVQRQLYERVFRDQPIEDYLRAEVAALRAGARDALLAYRRPRRERPSTDSPTEPFAAPRPGPYVVTRGGPEPAAASVHPIDYEHYVQRQLRPIAEPVLALFGLSFDRVIGDDRQLALF